MTALCLDTLRKKIDEQLPVWEVPGVMVGIYHDGKVLMSEGFGRKNEAGERPDGRTLFQIGSCSKAFTAAAAMILKERGVLDLDKPVAEYLPDFKLMDSYANANVTVRDLLCHRSGLPRHEYAWYHTPFTREQLVHNLRYHKPNMGLRQGFQYNNLGYVLVGWIIEKLTGKTWEDFVEEELFRPIGMERTTCFLDAAFADGNYAEIYGRPDMNVAKGIKSVPFYRTPEVEDYAKRIGAPFGPAGSIVSCAEDMLKWGIFHMGDGTTADGKRILSPESMKELHTAHVVCNGTELPDGSQNLCYGLGWRVYSYHGRMIYCHSGGIDGATTEFYVIPAEKLVVVTNVNLYVDLFCNAVAMDVVDKMLGVESDQFVQQKEAMTAMFAQMAEIAEGMAGTPVPGTRTSHDICDYAGVYSADGYTDITITEKDGALSFHFIGEDVPMSHFHYDIFRLDGYFGENPNGLTVKFDCGKEGKIDRLTVPMVLDPGVEPICFRKKDN